MPLRAEIEQQETLERNQIKGGLEKLKIVSRPNKIREFIDVVEEENIVGQIKPFHAGQILQWQVEGIAN